MLNGNDYLLFKKDGAEWKTVACLRSNGISMSTGEITSETKCGNGAEESVPGTTNWSMSFEGDAIDDEADPSQVSYDALFDSWKSRSIEEWKIAGVGTDYVRYGKGYINQLDENQDVNAPFTFSGSIKGTGQISKTEPDNGGSGGDD